ncbi:MAG: hypothetical protein KJS91_05865 [Planctomycetes bacterium]|nr:hypothetical protein [Planctomycetota bacterium]
MFRSLVLGLAALALVVGGIVAEEYKGKLGKVDASAKKITIETKDGEKTFGYAEGLKVKVKGKDGDKEIEVEKAKAGSFVAVTTKKDGDKEVVTEIKAAGGGKKKESK